MLHILHTCHWLSNGECRLSKTSNAIAINSMTNSSASNLSYQTLSHLKHSNMVVKPWRTFHRILNNGHPDFFLLTTFWAPKPTTFSPSHSPCFLFCRCKQICTGLATTTPNKSQMLWMYEDHMDAMSARWTICNHKRWALVNHYSCNCFKIGTN